jgi:hypothetical protein
MRKACSILVGVSEGERLLGRFRCSWEDNIKNNIREMWKGLDPSGSG